VVKARQIGFSQTFALEALYCATQETESTILLVSRSQDLAVNLLRYCYLTYNNLKNAPQLIKSNESEMGFGVGFVSGDHYSGARQGSRIKSIPANRSTGRGFAANRAYLDEFAYAEYAEDIYQSVGPALAHGGQLAIASTPNGIGNLFHALYVSDDSFQRMFVPWYECPAYYTEAERDAGIIPTECAWYKQERPKYTTSQWASEYDCDFAGSGAAVYQLEDINAAENGAVGEQGRIDGHEYLTSADIGRRRDATVINTFDLSAIPFQRVAHTRLERVPYPAIQAEIERHWHNYGGQVYVESNGPGDPVLENLKVPANAFVTSARSKFQGLQSLALLLERHLVKARWTAQERKELTIYQYDDKDITQDCVMSLMIGASQLIDLVDLRPTNIEQVNAPTPSAFARANLSGGRFGRSEKRGWHR